MRNGDENQAHGRLSVGFPPVDWSAPVTQMTLAFALLAATAAAQDTPPADTVSPRAAKLEAELSRYKPGSPDAAAVLLQLLDLYHDNGRVFGLIRAGQTFVGTQPSHPRHADAVLKLLDGLTALSRHKEIVVTARQFLERHPTHARAGHVEGLLARALRTTGDRAAAGETFEALWRRLGNTPQGRQAAVDAFQLYVALGTVDAYGKAAKLAEALFDQGPASDFGAQAGQMAVLYWNYAQQWAKAVAVGTKILAKSAPADKDALRDLHLALAQDYARLAQHANAADNYRKALAIALRPELHYQLIQSLVSAQAKPAELGPVVTAYLEKYPTSAERGAVRGLLALALLANKETERGLALLAEVLPEDARTNDFAGHYVRNNSKPGQAAQNEAVLKAALLKNKKDASVLRYYLGFEVYQNQMKDKARARQTIRELVTLSPAADGQTDGALTWLLSNAANDEEFKADFAAVLKARREHLELSQYRVFIQNWFNRARQSKENPARVAWAKAELEKANQEPLVRDWLQATEAADPAVAASACAALTTPAPGDPE